MARELIERAAAKTALVSYLTSRGWTGIRYEEGFDIEDTITVPLVSIHLLPSTAKSLQLGNENDKLFNRVLQFDAYMENEGRASAIIDDIMDFVDITPITITDVVQNSVVGSLTCQNTESIYGEIFAPILTDVKVKRWRGIVRATYEAHYP